MELIKLKNSVWLTCSPIQCEITGQKVTDAIELSDPDGELIGTYGTNVAYEEIIDQLKDYDHLIVRGLKYVGE